MCNVPWGKFKTHHGEVLKNCTSISFFRKLLQQSKCWVDRFLTFYSVFIDLIFFPGIGSPKSTVLLKSLHGNFIYNGTIVLIQTVFWKPAPAHCISQMLSLYITETPVPTVNRYLRFTETAARFFRMPEIVAVFHERLTWELCPVSIVLYLTRGRRSIT